MTGAAARTVARRRVGVVAQTRGVDRLQGVVAEEEEVVEGADAHRRGAGIRGPGHAGARLIAAMLLRQALADMPWIGRPSAVTRSPLPLRLPVHWQDGLICAPGECFIRIDGPYK